MLPFGAAKSLSATAAAADDDDDLSAGGGGGGGRGLGFDFAAREEELRYVYLSVLSDRRSASSDRSDRLWCCFCVWIACGVDCGLCVSVDWTRN